MKNIDCTGLTCPGPVIQVKKILEETPPGESFSVDVNSETSRDNVRRFSESRGATVHTEGEKKGATRLVITAPADTVTRGHGDAMFQEKYQNPPVVFITGETLGQGDDKLGRILMEGFINSLLEQDRIPDRIFFMNAGVKFTVQGSAVLNTLEEMTDRGCEVLVCGTCLEFFSLSDKLSVGTVSNMFDIQGALLTAPSVVTV